jgi:hypothetical protein
MEVIFMAYGWYCGLMFAECRPASLALALAGCHRDQSGAGSSK